MTSQIVIYHSLLSFFSAEPGPKLVLAGYAPLISDDLREIEIAYLNKNIFSLSSFANNFERVSYKCIYVVFK